MAHLGSMLGPTLTPAISGELASPLGPLYSPSFSPDYDLPGGGLGLIEGLPIAPGMFWKGSFVGDLSSPLGPLYLPSTGANELPASASDTLEFAEDAGCVVYRAAVVEEELELVEDADGVTFNQFVVESLSLDEEAIGYRAFNGTASESLSLVETMLRVFTYEASDVLNIAEQADADRILRVVEALDALTESVTRTRLHFESRSESFTLSEVLLRTVEMDVEETLTLVEVLNRIKIGQATDSLTLEEEALATAVKAIFENIDFVEEVEQNGSIFYREVEEELDFVEVALDFFQSGNSACLETYEPAVALGIRSGIRLTYPYVTPTLTVDVKNPEFGNVHSVKKSIKVKRTITGQLRVSRSSNWPVIEELRLKFENITLAKRDELIEFFTTSAGYEIGLLDHENRQWRGVISSPTTSTSQSGRSDCEFTAEFSFRGSLV